MCVLIGTTLPHPSGSYLVTARLLNDPACRRGHKPYHHGCQPLLHLPGLTNLPSQLWPFVLLMLNSVLARPGKDREPDGTTSYTELQLECELEVSAITTYLICHFPFPVMFLFFPSFLLPSGLASQDKATFFSSGQKDNL